MGGTIRRRCDRNRFANGTILNIYIMKNAFTLKEIADWLNLNSEIQLPALQRGLVWKRNQIELLWDSILREFPIGTFMLAEGEKKENVQTYFLMDGQQRYNAISLGYNKSKIEHPDMILWLDIDPVNKPSNSTRTYWIKSTTITHPWGYRNDDECSTLSANDRRSALEKYGMAGKNIYKEEIDLRETWPYCAQLPIPLFFFLEARLEDEKAFVEDVKTKIEQYKTGEHGFKYFSSSSFDSNGIDEKIGKYYEVFKRLSEYQVLVNVLPKSIIDKETEESQNEGTALEMLFTRLNTGGTRISQEDLFYSAIKAYWPEIKDLNDELALDYMKPERLAMLVFRLIQTLNKENRDSLANELSLAQIRKLANDKDVKNQVIDLYNNKLKDILTTIDGWLGINPNDESSTPTLLRMSILSKSTDLYLLLMYFAYKYKDADKDIMGGLAFYIHWFSTKKKKECINTVYKRCKDSIALKDIDNALYAAISFNYLKRPFAMSEIAEEFKVDSCNDGNYWAIYGNKPWMDFLGYVFWQRELLLYAERKYLNQHFKLYNNPMKYGMWNEHTVPWDYDHITPRDWMSNKRNADCMRYCQYWRDNIGNLAAIPFEINRSKSNGSDYEEYDRNKELLFFNADSKTLSADSVARNWTQARKFAEITFKRCCQIYEECAVLWSKLFTSECISKRKSLFEKVLKMDGWQETPHAHFVSGNIEFPVKDEMDWAQEWISVGGIVKGYYVCICSNKITLEIGLRKNSEDAKINLDKKWNNELNHLDGYTLYNSGWWYVEKDLQIDKPDDEVLEELKRLKEMIQNLKV